MDVYLDITFVGLFLTFYITSLTVDYLCSQKGIWKRFVLTFVLSLVIVFYNKPFYFPLVYIIVVNLLFYRRKIKQLILALFFITFLFLFQGLFTNEIYLVKLIPYARSIYALIVYSLSLASLIILSFITIRINKKLVTGKYIHKVVLYLQGKPYHLLGYLDSGNSLTINSLPVIYFKIRTIKEKPRESLKEDLGRLNSGLIKYKQKNIEVEHKVYIALVSDKYDFYGCECLLNVLLF